MTGTPQVQSIRRLWRNGESVASIARKTHAGGADGAQVPGEGGFVGRAVGEEAARVGGRTRICPRSQQWLAGDRANWRKQRHTATRIWERSGDEHGAEVSLSTVTRAVVRTGPASRCSRPGSPRAWRVSNTTMTGRIRVNTTSRSLGTSACREAGDGHEDGRRALREGPQAVHLQGEHRRIRRLGHAPPGRRRPPPARHGTGEQGTREARQAPAPRPVPRRQGSRRLRLHERQAPRRLHAR